MRRLRGNTSAEGVARSIRAHVESLTSTVDSSAGLVKVSLHFSFAEGKHPTERIVAFHQLEKFLLAILELHFSPGLNPHNRNEAAEVQCITTATLQPRGPYWWSTPGLQENNDPNGVVIFSWEMTPRIAWLRPGVELPSSLPQPRR